MVDRFVELNDGLSTVNEDIARFYIHVSEILRMNESARPLKKFIRAPDHFKNSPTVQAGFKRKQTDFRAEMEDYSPEPMADVFQNPSQMLLVHLPFQDFVFKASSVTVLVLHVQVTIFRPAGVVSYYVGVLQDAVSINLIVSKAPTERNTKVVIRKVKFYV